MKELVVIHAADLHIGKNRKFADYLEQQKIMLEVMVTQIVEFVVKNLDKEVWLIIAGDVFDRNEDTTREEFALFMSFIGSLSSKTVLYPLFHVFIIDGNHDRQPSERYPSVLSPLKRFIPPKMTMAVVDPMYIEDKNLLLVPFGGYKEKDLKQLLNEYPNAQFLVAHECFAGIQTDIGYTPPRDQDKYIEFNNLIENRSLSGVFLGDIHRSQQLSPTCWYSGSPVTLDHGHKLPKGMLYHYFVNEDGNWHKKSEPQLIPLNDPRIRYHYQFGKILDSKDIPWETFRNYEHSYIQVLISPEIYSVIDHEIPGFFASPLVNWEFDNKEIAKDQIYDDEENVSDSIKEVREHYRPLIVSYANEVLTNLTEEERGEFFKLIFEVFDSRS